MGGARSNYISGSANYISGSARGEANEVITKHPTIGVKVTQFPTPPQVGGVGHIIDKNGY